uniref:Negative elongation factor E n=1 Tax=Cacopsylla melanoneura TaxID=428564 RepID=A0A8D8VCY6_9HEMI
MVYIHFPSNHTEEEITLQAKYQKLKRKKKSLQAQKAPRPEPERTQVSSTMKRPIEAKDAREVARKLLKSGAINPIVRPAKRCEQEGFKRPRGLERKLTETDRSTVSAYQPFSAVQPEDSDPVDLKPKFMKSELYENFVSAKRETNDDRTPVDKKAYGTENLLTRLPPGEKPKGGNTIFVQGLGISEEFLRQTFSSYGKICNVSMELEKGRGFVTFDGPESSEKAITEINGTVVQGIKLKVSLARRQLKVQPINDAGSSTTWCALACHQPLKGNHRDKRQVVQQLTRTQVL